MENKKKYVKNRSLNKLLVVYWIGNEKSIINNKKKWIIRLKCVVESLYSHIIFNIIEEKKNISFSRQNRNTFLSSWLSQLSRWWALEFEIFWNENWLDVIHIIGIICNSIRYSIITLFQKTLLPKWDQCIPCHTSTISLYSFNINGFVIESRPIFHHFIVKHSLFLYGQVVVRPLFVHCSWPLLFCFVAYISTPHGHTAFGSRTQFTKLDLCQWHVHYLQSRQKLCLECDSNVKNVNNVKNVKISIHYWKKTKPMVLPRHHHRLEKRLFEHHSVLRAVSICWSVDRSNRSVAPQTLYKISSI